MRKIEEKHLQEQTKIKQELVEKHEESMRRLRDKMEEQREDIVSSEENNWREKFRSLTKSCEIRVEELRVKMEQREEQQRQRYERDREQQIYTHDATIKQLQNEHKKKVNEIEMRHQQILDDLHAKQDARLTVESARMAESRQEWQQIQLEKMKLENKEKEKVFRENFDESGIGKLTKLFRSSMMKIQMLNRRLRRNARSGLINLKKNSSAI